MSRKWLLVRFSAIGDCVMASYVATAIRELEQDCLLDWAVESRCAPVVDQIKLVNHRIEFPRDIWRRNRWSPITWNRQLSLFSSLRRERYDVGLDLQGHSKTAICLRIAKPSKRIAAFATDALSRRLNPQLPGNADGKHRVERMLDAASAFAPVKMPSKPLMPPHLQAGLDNSKQLISISTGAGAAVKMYPIERWEAVAKTLADRGFDVVFLGASVDPKPKPDIGRDMVGKTDLATTMSIVADSKLHLSADTGTGHMAAAYGVPFVSVFGPTNPFLFRPYSDIGTVLHYGQSTADCPVDAMIEAASGWLT